MAHVVSCPNGHRIQVTDAHVGTTLSCPTCNTSFVVPAAPPPAPGLSVRLAHLGEEAKFLRKYVLPVGRALFVIGLLVVVLLRCADAMWARQPERKQAILTLEKNAFQDRIDDLKARETNELAQLQGVQNPTDAQKKRIAELQAVTPAMKALQDEQKKLQDRYWRDLQIEARDANAHANLAMSNHAREFLLGTIILVIGLLLLAMSAAGAERLVALILLAVVVASLFGGIRIG